MDLIQISNVDLFQNSFHFQRLCLCMISLGMDLTFNFSWIHKIEMDTYNNQIVAG